MPKKTAASESKHEHWLRKSVIVAVIASVITFLGGLNLLIYTTGHVVGLTASVRSVPFWIAVVTLFVVAVLVDYARSNLKKVYWFENFVGALFGALGYYGVLGLIGVPTFTSISGFVLGAIELFALFYFGFMVGHLIDVTWLKPSGIEIN